MSLTLDQVRHVAELARLQMSEQEMQHMLGHLAEMIDVFDNLRQVDTEGLEPTSHSAPLHNVWREDRAEPSGLAANILECAISTRGGLFIVPAILEEE